MDIFKSKRFWSTVVGLLVMVLVGLVPALEENADLLVSAILALVSVTVVGYTAEDVIQPKAGRGSNSISSAIKTLTIDNTRDA